MGTNSEATVKIDATPQQVFGYLAELSAHLLWSGGLVKVEPSGHIYEGLTYKTVNTEIGKEFEAINKVTKLVPNQLLELHNESGPIRYDISYRLEPIDGATRVTCSSELEFDSNIFKLAEPVLELFATNKIQGDLDRLKILVESDEKPPELY